VKLTNEGLAGQGSSSVAQRGCTIAQRGSDLSDCGGGLSDGSGDLSDGGGGISDGSGDPSDGGGGIGNWSVSESWGRTVSQRSSGGYDGGGADDTGVGDGHQGGEDEELLDEDTLLERFSQHDFYSVKLCVWTLSALNVDVIGDFITGFDARC
jgi:hypothetical protein